MDDFEQERWFDAVLDANTKGFDAGWNTLAGEIQGILAMRLDSNEKIRLIRVAAQPMKRA